jgi:hypothetical protein
LQTTLWEEKEGNDIDEASTQYAPKVVKRLRFKEAEFVILTDVTEVGDVVDGRQSGDEVGVSLWNVDEEGSRTTGVEVDCVLPGTLI